ncbi:hypothetical protein [Mobilicoccus massiliensis]|uniref:hypothetical protein n=1 Tax=Mobilicoccus massiliensis TaxID=1522310 RepID=UPI0005913CAF|nr:hypothetical protein [Mobilicoccus massiliensis]
MNPGSLSIRPLQLSAGGPADVAAQVRALLDDIGGVLVVDATVLGPRLPARERVVEVMRRGHSVVSERLGPEGVRRVVRVIRADGSCADLVDAGAQAAGDGMVAFPPVDAGAAASELRVALGGTVEVVLASRASTTPVAPVALAVAGEAPSMLATLLGCVDAPAVLVTGYDDTVDLSDGGAVVDDHGYEAVRTALGVVPGTAAAFEAGLPAEGDDVEERIARACRVAAQPFPVVGDGHPARKYVRMRVDLDAVTLTTVQTGVRVQAPDDLSLGVAVGRLVVALAAEGIAATPVQHGVDAGGPSALVAYLDDAGAPGRH